VEERKKLQFVTLTPKNFDTLENKLPNCHFILGGESFSASRFSAKPIWDRESRQLPNAPE
jgi:hypothetical protein